MSDQILVITATEQLVLGGVTAEILEVALQGPPGPTGPAGGTDFINVGAAALSGNSVVAVDANGLLIAADSTVAAHFGKVTGLLANAYAPGAPATIQRGGVMTHLGWTWTPNLPLLVGAGGALSHTLPAGALFSQTVAFALSATEIIIEVQPPIHVI